MDTDLKHKESCRTMDEKLFVDFSLSEDDTLLQNILQDSKTEDTFAEHNVCHDDIHLENTSGENLDDTLSFLPREENASVVMSDKSVREVSHWMTSTPEKKGLMNFFWPDDKETLPVVVSCVSPTHSWSNGTVFSQTSLSPSVTTLPCLQERKIKNRKIFCDQEEGLVVKIQMSLVRLGKRSLHKRSNIRNVDKAASSKEKKKRNSRKVLRTK